MADKMDWCKYFFDIEADPEAVTPRITVRQMFEAREHLLVCDACYNRTERVVANTTRERFLDRGIN